MYQNNICVPTEVSKDTIVVQCANWIVKSTTTKFLKIIWMTIHDFRDEKNVSSSKTKTKFRAYFLTLSRSLNLCDGLYVRNIYIR